EKAVLPKSRPCGYYWLKMITARAIETAVRRISNDFEPERIILFGSYACGQPNHDSDVDLLVIKAHRGPGHRLAGKIRLAADDGFPMDILVRSAAQVERAVRQQDWFMIDVL